MFVADSDVGSDRPSSLPKCRKNAGDELPLPSIIKSTAVFAADGGVICRVGGETLGVFL